MFRDRPRMGCAGSPARVGRHRCRRDGARRGVGAGHSSPAVTHAHYIDGATGRRARTRRVIGKVVGSESTLRVVDGAAPGKAMKAGKTGKTGRRTAVPRDPGLHVVGTEPAAAPQPTGSAHAGGNR